jgi:hypothetical protein
MTLSFSSLSGGTSFTVITSTGGSKTATLSKTFPAGTYLIESMAADTNLEIYLGASDGTQVGSCVAGAKSVTASASFLYVTTVNADTNDAVTFTLKSAATLATKTDAFWAPPTITDITPSGLPNVNDTTTITGTNFASNVEVKFRKSDDSTLVTPKTKVRGSATSIIVGRPDSFAVGDAPYDVIVTNPTTTFSVASLEAITAGAVPVWVTSSTLNAATINSVFSQTIQATDADGGSSITYAIVSGALQTGLSLNTSTGAITGTPTGSSGSTTIVISATDSGGNSVNRTFTQDILAEAILVDLLVIAGGGGGGGSVRNLSSRNPAGGGGAGGYLEQTGRLLAAATTYSISIGGGGSGTSSGSPGNNTRAGTGTNTTFGLVTALGGGGAGNGDLSAGGNGGSGGGSADGAAAGSATQGNSDGATGYGNAGGIGNTGAGGGGAGGVGQATGAGGNGRTWSINSTTYAGGGGGGGVYNGAGGAGGSGGGGTGGSGLNSNGTAGSSNTGGGGGGQGSAPGTTTSGSGANGGSGIVIIRTLNTASSSTVSPTTSGSYKIYTFTASGSITF